MTIGLILCSLFQLIPIFAQAPIQNIHTSTNQVKYTVGDSSPEMWILAPELKPDRLHAECDEEPTVVKFISDLDSVSYAIHLGDTVQFNIIHGLDTALTEIVGTVKNVNFSEAYILANKDKILVEIPEVHELLNIMMALTEMGRLDNNLTDMTTDYYSEVKEYFEPYMDHPSMKLMNDLIAGPLENGYAPMASYYNYYGLKMDACVYEFNDRGEIVNKGIIGKASFNAVDNLV